MNANETRATAMLQSPPRRFELVMRALGSPAVNIVLWDGAASWEPERAQQTGVTRR
jgi:hypothetical protein